MTQISDADMQRLATALAKVLASAWRARQAKESDKRTELTRNQSMREAA